MQILDNINTLWGDDLRQTLKPGARFKIAASCFSIYAYEALKDELEKIDFLEFIFTAPTFVENEVTDKISKERREFHIPKRERERSLYGSEFEIQLKNKLTQRAIAKECADWMRQKAKFRSNATRAPMQQFACVDFQNSVTVYLPLHGFTAVDLGYQPGNAVSNLITKINEAPSTKTYLQLFDQIWNDTSKVEDVTENICAHIESVYQECFEKELKNRNIPFVSQPELTLAYKGEALKQTYKPDFICYGQIIVELKAVKEIAPEHKAQVLNYLKTAGMKLGLLVNFGSYPKATVNRLAL